MADVDSTFIVTVPTGHHAGTYKFKLGDCSGLDDLEVRKATGLSLVGLLEACEEDHGLVLVLAATVVWLCKRRDFGTHTTFEDVARSLNWEEGFTFDTDDGDTAEVGKGPESVNGNRES
jgi:hypothetical protein